MLISAKRGYYGGKIQFLHITFSRSTGPGKKTVPRLREFCSCCCLPFLPGLAWKILATWEPFFCRALYIRCWKSVILAKSAFFWPKLLSSEEPALLVSAETLSVDHYLIANVIGCEIILLKRSMDLTTGMTCAELPRLLLRPRRRLRRRAGSLPCWRWGVRGAGRPRCDSRTAEVRFKRR